MVCSDTDPKAPVMASDGDIYKFQSIQDVKFIIPYNTPVARVHLYVQPTENDNFVRIKKFAVSKPDVITHKIDYLLTVLRHFDSKIADSSQFYEHIHITLSAADISMIKRSKLLYAPVVFDSKLTCLHRLVEELKIDELNNMLKVYDSKTKCISNYPSFNCSILQIAPIVDDEKSGFFSENEYKLVSYSDNEDDNNAGMTETFFKYTDKIIVSYNISLYTMFNILVKNPKLFGIDDYIELHQIDPSTHTHFSNRFYNALTLENNQIITIKNKCNWDLESKEIVNSKYIILCNDNRYQIKSESVQNDDTKYIYTLNDIKDVQFVVPFNTNTHNVSIYVQLRDDLDFVAFKLFNIKQGDDQQQEHEETAKLNYLYDMLLSWTQSISDINAFCRKIGFDVKPIVEIMIQKQNNYDLFTFCKEYNPENRIFDRLYEEFDAQMLSNHHTLLHSTFQLTFFDKVFGYCLYTIERHKNNDAQDEKMDIFEDTQYRLSSICGTGKEEKTLRFDDTIIIKGIDSFDRYKVSIKNEKLFLKAEWIEIQELNKPDFSKCSNMFADHLETVNNKIIKYISLLSYEGDYGTYDIIKSKDKGTFIVDSKSQFCSIRAKARLSTGKYYYEVIIREINSKCPGFYIGWADSGFIPNDKQKYGVGIDYNRGHSWSCTGCETWHDDKQSDNFNVVYDLCICGEQMERIQVTDTMQDFGTYNCCDYCRHAIRLYDHIYHCKNHSDKKQHYYLCSKHKPGRRDRFWGKCDIVGCCVDMDKGEISYYLNEEFVGVAFKNIDFKNKILFPAVSMFNNQSIELRFNSFEANWSELSANGYHTVPNTGLYLIDPAHDYILNRQYTLRCGMFESVYTFNDMKNIQFVVPLRACFAQHSKVDVYVNAQSRKSDELVLLKTFDIKPLNAENLELQYLLDFLMVYDRQITNPNVLYRKMGTRTGDQCFEWNNEWLSILRTSPYYAMLTKTTPLNATALNVTVLDRLIHELEIEYEEKKDGTEYKEDIHMKDLSGCFSIFADYLQIVNGKTIQYIEHKFEGDYGQYDVSKGYFEHTLIVDSKSQFCSIRAKCALTAGKYYYEVYIRKENEECPGFYIGWADEGFIPNDKENYGVGIDCSDSNSWASNGFETWHNGKQSETFSYDYWKKGDIVGCGIDIDDGTISYWLNQRFVGVAFKNIRFKTKKLFPAISMFNHQSMEIIFDHFQSQTAANYRKIPQPTLYSIVDEKDYDEILNCNYILRCSDTKSDTSDAIYRFDSMDCLQFVTPFRTHLQINSKLNVYVRSPKHKDLVLLKTFDTKYLKQYGNATEANQYKLPYLLDVLAVYRQNITDVNDFYHKIGIQTHTDAFKWNPQWISVLQTSEYKSILDRTTPLNVNILHRLMNELQLQYVGIALKVLETTQFEVNIYTIFEHFSMQINYDNVIDVDQNTAILNCDYKLVEVINNKERTIRHFKHDENVMVQIRQKQQRYIVYIRNEELFHTDHYYKLQSIEMSDDSTNALCQDFFANNLKIENDMIIALDSNRSLQKYHEQILNATYLMIYNDDMDPKAPVMGNDGYIYTFESIQNVKFIIPYSIQVARAYLYVQPTKNCDFVWIKTFALSTPEDTCIDDSYKPSLSTGVYGVYSLQSMDVKRMPSNYNASFCTGIYGVYALETHKIDAFQSNDDKCIDGSYKPSLSTGVYGVYSLQSMEVKRMPSNYNPSFYTGIYGVYALETHKVDTLQSNDEAMASSCKIDYLLAVLSHFDSKIADPNQFYERLRIDLNSADIAIVKRSKRLYAQTALDSKTTCLHRLVDELKVDELKNVLRAYDLKTKCIAKYPSFNYNILEIARIADDEPSDFITENEYKLVSYSNSDNDDEKNAAMTETLFKYTDKLIVSYNISLYTIFKILVKNPTLFGIDDYIELEEIDPSTQQQFSNIFYESLSIVKNQIIIRKNNINLESESKEILNSKYVIVCNDNRYQIKSESISNDCIYVFNDIKDIQFVVPFHTNLNKVNIYVQLNDDLDFVAFKSFDIEQNDNQQRENVDTAKLNYLYNTLLLWIHNITDTTGFDINSFSRKIGFDISSFSRKIGFDVKQIVEIMIQKQKDLETSNDSTNALRQDFFSNNLEMENDIIIFRNVFHPNIADATRMVDPENKPHWNDQLETIIAPFVKDKRAESSDDSENKDIVDEYRKRIDEWFQKISQEEMILNAKYLLMQNENRQQLVELSDDAKSNIYQFDDMNNIKFPISRQTDVDIISVYVQLETQCDFSLIKTFDVQCKETADGDNKSNNDDVETETDTEIQSKDPKVAVSMDAVHDTVEYDELLEIKEDPSTMNESTDNADSDNEHAGNNDVKIKTVLDANDSDGNETVNRKELNETKGTSDTKYVE